MLDLVGDGPQRGEIEAKCRRSAWITTRFHGWVDTQRVFQIMENADIMFLPRSARACRSLVWRG